ncbi:aldo/keto reductase [Vibrio sp. BS-M-Sm-2]|uniref:aldo/keto reductase n=1 Tax=unclassified Vibrio TaxID=2614977 RepID=UPI00255BB628|nr:aldo/keto reductase [Vibrio sp. TMPB1044]MDL5028675.1 aldo/keto reductase [Vibrio sp. TMPB1044]MDN5208803.1 aldo/keto reductase [Vibrio sp. TMPB1044]
MMASIGGQTLAPVALGCMNLSHAYGTPPQKSDSIKLLNQALDLGYNMLDTAALYGFGANESLLAEAVGHRRHEFFLASKCGMFKGPDGKRAIDGRPETIRKTCEDSLQRLNTDVIDLYYLHRWDKSVPIEESIGELSRLVEEGKIKHIGLSEVSADTIAKANAVHKIAAVQSEYSLWSRNPEIAVIEQCQKIDATFVSFSPVGRGMLTGEVKDNQFVAGDIRLAMPRFSDEHFESNLSLVRQFESVLPMFAEENGFSINDNRGSTPTLAQLALAWTLKKAPNSIALPGTTSLQHLEDNWNAQQLSVSDELLRVIDDIIPQNKIAGGRYNAATQREIDTEEF